MAKLLAALSGGVDSAVAAALLSQRNHDVTAVTLKQWDHPDEEVRLTKGCNTLDAVDDARRAADTLGIPHYTFDFRDTFTTEVIEPFVAEYAAGRTPNPCVRCNAKVRFGALLGKAMAMGFDGLITGHYARVKDGRLHKARCADKDQSYVLYRLSQHALSKANFPLGDFESKAEVRQIAQRLGLPNYDREDSVDVCFIPEGTKHSELVAASVPSAMTHGAITNRQGERVGHHHGIASYTIGQRRGLQVSTRQYVIAIDQARNEIQVGGEDDLLAESLRASNASYPSGCKPADGTELEALIRYRAKGVPAIYSSTNDGFALTFLSPVRAVTPGQSVVLYDSDQVVGGGIIET